MHSDFSMPLGAGGFVCLEWDYVQMSRLLAPDYVCTFVFDLYVLNMSYVVIALKYKRHILVIMCDNWSEHNTETT